ncbi:MAG: hypothetical protein AB1401_11920 [Thermodesulfobacteriota bacterium]
MEKIEILKKVCRLKIFRNLSTDELKLYILLLIFAQGLNKEEQVDLEIIRRLSGKIYTIEELKEIGFSLKKHKLASLSLSYSKEDKDCHLSYKGSQNVKLSFELYDYPYKCE